MTTLSFDIAGSGGRTIIGLHGLAGDRSQPLEVIDRRTLATTRVILPDLRGHGETVLDDSPSSLTFSRLAADVEQLAEELSVTDGVILMGTSMGAAVVAELLARSRLSVAGAILIRPAWRWRPWPPNLRLFARIAELLESHPADVAADIYRRGSEYAALAAVSPHAAAASMGQFDASDALRRVERLRAIPGSAPMAPMGAPAGQRRMVIACELDPIHPVALAHMVAADLRAPLEIVSPRYDAPEQHATEVGALIHRLVSEDGEL